MEAGNCPCIKLVKVLLKKLQNDLFKVLYVPWITAYIQPKRDRSLPRASGEDGGVCKEPDGEECRDVGICGVL